MIYIYMTKTIGIIFDVKETKWCHLFVQLIVLYMKNIAHQINKEQVTETKVLDMPFSIN